MSYILDALRKSEAERRQGKAPDLGQPVQMIYRPRRKPVSAVVWVALALFVNAGVLAWLFWPKQNENIVPLQKAPALANEKPEPMQVDPGFRPDAYDDSTEEEIPAAAPVPKETPVVIVPHRPDGEQRRKPAMVERMPQGRVPHLVELPLSFQKSIPDLTFNSHIFASDPSASRVMINGHYLKPGDGFGSLTVERITEDGVVLSKNGQFFRVGTVRDWVSPK